MSGLFVDFAKTFRQKFTLPDKNMIKWFPNHMQKGVLDIQHRLRNIDCVVEIHDARIPISGRNPRFNDIISLRPHILVYNKVDLADMAKKDIIVTKMKKAGVKNILFTQATSGSNVMIERNLVPLAIESVRQQPRYHREELNEFNILVMGVPNIGKSTFLNSVRRLTTMKHKKAAKVGAMAGVTKNIGNRVRISTSPDIFLIDTPGILNPSVPDIDTGMKLALCGCMPDHFVGEEYVVDYMLYWFNKYRNFQYTTVFNLPEPTDDVLKFLKHVALSNRMVKRIKSPENHQYVYVPDFLQASTLVLKKFRSGALGKVMLDEDLM